MGSIRGRRRLLAPALACACAVGSADDGGDVFSGQLGDDDSATYTPIDPGPECGNGVVEADETCDGLDLDEATCTSSGFAAGVLACDAACELDFSQCTSCGNELIDAGEACDGAIILHASCLELGYEGGSLRCSDDCLEVLTDECEGGPGPPPGEDPEPDPPPRPGAAPYSPCAGDSDCPAGEHCAAYAGACSPTCATDSDCPAEPSASAMPECHEASATCYLVCEIGTVGACPAAMTCEAAEGRSAGLCAHR